MTPMTPMSIAAMQEMWEKHNLPEVDFSHWSQEFARETWEVIQDWTTPEFVGAFTTPEDARAALLQVLKVLECYDPDPTKQQWVPRRPL